MERTFIGFNLPNFITIGLIFALWYILIVGGGSLLLARSGNASA